MVAYESFDCSSHFFLRKKKEIPEKLRSIAVGDEVINPSECARNIGVMLDQNLNMEQQITTICKSAFFHTRNIRKVRKYLPQHAAETVVNALVTSRLDNCNALLLGLYRNFNMYRILGFHMTSRPPCWCPKQRKGGHVGAPIKSSGNLTLLLCKRFLLFSLKNMAVDDVSENQQ